MDLRSDSNSNSANVAPVVETKSSPNSPLNASAVVMEAELVGEKKSDHQPGRKGKGKKGKKRGAANTLTMNLRSSSGWAMTTRTRRRRRHGRKLTP